MFKARLEREEESKRGGKKEAVVEMLMLNLPPLFKSLSFLLLSPLKCHELLRECDFWAWICQI